MTVPKLSFSLWLIQSAAHVEEPWWKCQQFLFVSVNSAWTKRKHLVSKNILKRRIEQGRSSVDRKSSAPARGLSNFFFFFFKLWLPATPPLTIQRFSQVHHGDFSVAVHGRDSRVQAGLGQSTKRHSKKLETPLEG